ncbi:hypothetical protein NFB41_01615 [Yersinia ruckeri]|uniref:hypothetical protein n=1 Tax=Yersinia ruckeri TaxID=29486 RepID=UPI002238AFD4|nr:hypothetical protein [Yersinia ruckeri]MCW6583213.1 hypothetical protein [Yersinia ruckeri]
MDKHIEALSKPVAWTDDDELADMDSNTHGNIFNAKYIDIHNGRWLPLYSQEYVGSLLSQLEAAQKGMDDFQRSCDRHHKVSVGLNERLIASEAVLSAANEKLKGDQVPVDSDSFSLTEAACEKWKLVSIEANKKVAALGDENRKLRTEIAKIKGSNMPVGVIDGWLKERDKPFKYKVASTQELEDGTELFTAPQNPVVLPDYRCSHDMHAKQYYETIGFNIGLDACKAAIKAAGFTVEGE